LLLDSVYLSLRFSSTESGQVQVVFLKPHITHRTSPITHQSVFDAGR
jgi:hypothetical protein